MAASTVMADFGRMPTNRKVLVFAVTGLLLGGLYYRFIYTPLAADTAEARQAYESAQRTHATGVANLKKYAELRPEMDQLRAQLARNQAALPTEAEVPAFFETLERKVKESGVEILKWTKRSEEAVETFVKVPVEIEITGTFMQIKRFFASLVQRNLTPGDPDERERIVSIDSLVISQPAVRNREIFLIAKFVAVTFRQDDKPPAPARPGAPSPIPAASGPPQVPPQPPLRPGGGEGLPTSPADAKARIDEAMKESERRGQEVQERGSGAPASPPAPPPAAGSDRLRKGM
jgi:type IV pilus assembly protein PilO